VRDLGLDVTDSVGNFVLIHFDKANGKSAAAADAYLKSKGIIARGTGGYGLANSLRVTVGAEAENQAVVAALRDFLSE
ncbi:MAG: histidinol-phosphate transaminase, partial [Pseudomonadota bacterium]